MEEWPPLLLFWLSQIADRSRAFLLDRSEVFQSKHLLLQLEPGNLHLFESWCAKFRAAASSHGCSAAASSGLGFRAGTGRKVDYMLDFQDEADQETISAVVARKEETPASACD